MAIESVDPSTGERLQTFAPLTEAELDAKLERAAAAFPSWSRRPVGERARVVARAGEILLEDRAAFGRLMTGEMGKLYLAAQQEAEKCAAGCRYYADHAEEFLRPEAAAPASPGSRDEVRFEPLGVVLAVMPWNFPFWQVIRFAAPALCAGNVALLKHASTVPRCALALEDLFRGSGAPEGVFQSLLVGSAQVGRILADRR